MIAHSSRETRMGFFDKLANILGIKRRECNVLVVGLDNSGKSTVLNHFKPNEERHNEIVPTVGFNVERFKSRRSRGVLSSWIIRTRAPCCRFSSFVAQHPGCRFACP